MYVQQATVAHTEYVKELFMKKEYFSPEFELVKFKFEDIILKESGDPEFGGNDGNDFGFEKP